ncbi:nicotinate phosphoribosyltransferase [Candidatus Bathyarchaeota archaeon]|nr:MAG: nicotinate phosphoribosyltransferase [Candidatus Bathyarchaeota archaeon]
MRRFQIATEEEIKKGETTDVYFVRTNEILQKEGLTEQRVVAEVTTGSLPRDWDWAVLAGVEEAVHLMEGISVDVESLPEGSIFRPKDHRGTRLPVMTLEGRYLDFSLYETPLLGLLCQASGMATMAARVRKGAGKDSTILSFGIRRAHPVLAPMIDRACYLGGFDAVSSLIGARLLDLHPTGTMPHSLIVSIGDQVKAWKSFNKYMPKDVPRIALVDTYYDEKTESIMAAEALGKDLYGVRLDTPASRRGDFAEIIREVRWELDARGFDKVKIFVSGGLDEHSVGRYARAGADGFGVGSAVSSAPAVDFAMDIVEIEGRPVAKRGKLSWKKQVWRCKECLSTRVTRRSVHDHPDCPEGHGKMVLLSKEFLEKGRLVGPHLPKPIEIRESVLGQLELVELLPKL